MFFIDDLDRCLPANMLKMLEALKLYLNVRDCVYFLGLDHTIVRKGIEKEYAELKIEDQDYLDKIIQLPFAIPPIHGEKATPFIESLLPQEAKFCAAEQAGVALEKAYQFMLWLVPTVEKFPLGAI